MTSVPGERNKNRQANIHEETQTGGKTETIHEPMPHSNAKTTTTTTTTTTKTTTINREMYPTPYHRRMYKTSYSINIIVAVIVYVDVVTVRIILVVFVVAAQDTLHSKHLLQLNAQTGQQECKERGHTSGYIARCEVG